MDRACWLIVTLAILATGLVRADEPGSPAVAVSAVTTSALKAREQKEGEQKEATQAPGTERLAEMKRKADAIRVFGADGTTELKMVAEPVLRFSDPAREFSDATIWALGERGSPVALMSMERYQSQNKWWCELVALSPDKFPVGTPGWKWSPSKPSLELQRFAEAPAAAETAAGRLQRMKALARRFSVSEDGGMDDHYELRLMPQPIHRYADEEQGLVDGALFVFAYGTNPEAVAAVECHREGDSPASWQFGFVPLSSSTLQADLDGRQVWKCAARSRVRQQEPYTVFSMSLDP